MVCLTYMDIVIALYWVVVEVEVAVTVLYLGMLVSIDNSTLDDETHWV